MDDNSSAGTGEKQERIDYKPSIGKYWIGISAKNTNNQHIEYLLTL